MKYKVFAWYTGEMVKQCMRMMHGHPNFELVGALVYQKEKVGKDIGEIAGLPPIGIKAVDNIEDALAVDADCVLFAPPFTDYAMAARILESGKNLVSPHTGVYPKIFPEYSLLAAAAERGKASMMMAGIHPGFQGDYLPLLATSLCHDIDHILIQEWGCMSGSTTATLDFMGFGKSIADMQKDAHGMASYMSGSYKECVALIADGAGLAYDDFAVEMEVAPATKDCEGGLCKKGQVGAMRIIVHATANGKPVVTESNTWYIDDDMGEEWTSRKEAPLVVAIKGTPNIRLELGFEYEGHSEAEAGIAMSSARLMSCVPLVCNSPPGVITALDAPVPRHWRGVLRDAS